MLRAMLRDLRAHLGRVAMTLVAIVVGVGFVVATWVVSDSAAATVASAASRSDLAAQVMPTEGDGHLTSQQRDTLAALPGVTGASGVTVGYAALVNRGGKLTTAYAPDYGGTDWDSSQRFSLTGGRAPAGPHEVVLADQSAKDAGLAVNSSTKVLLAGGRLDTVLVVGTFSYRTAGSEIGPVIAYDEATARSLFGDQYARVELFGSDQTAITAAAAAAIGAGYQVDSGAQLAAEAIADADSSATAVRSFLLAFAGVALLVGMFVIANTFTMLVAQRTRQFALLRAVGATRGQVRRALLGEAAVLGATGAVVGIALGIGLGAATMGVLRGLGQSVVFTVSPAAILVGLAVGVLVTLVAAYGSARRAAAVAPVAALRTDAALPRRSLVVRTVFGATAVAIGVVMVAGSTGDTLTDGKRVLGMTGALLAWLGVLLLAPVLVNAFLRPLVRLSSNRLSRRPATKLALRNAIRDPRRTAATASALMIGLALVCAFATVGQTFTWAYTSGIKDSVPSTTFVVQPALFGSELDQPAVAAVRALSEVDMVVAPTTTSAELSHGSAHRFDRVIGIDPAALGRAVTAPITSGTANLDNGVLVGEDTARRLGLRVGDQLTLAMRDGASLTMAVNGLFERSDLLSGVLINPSRLPPGSAGHTENIFATGPDPTAVRAALDKAVADRPDLVVRDRDQLIDEAMRPLALVLDIVYALLGAAVLISIFGVVNTLALSVLERTREIGVLRAVGASRRFVRRSIRGESVVIASYGGLLGVGVGLLLGGVMQHVLTGLPILDLAVPYPIVAVALVGMVVIGVVAALWPARRASRTDVLAAIATQ